MRLFLIPLFSFVVLNAYVDVKADTTKEVSSPDNVENHQNVEGAKVRQNKQNTQSASATCSIKEAVHNAFKTNNIWKLQKESLAIAHDKLIKTKREFLPNISLEYNRNYNQNFYTNSQNISENSSKIGLSVSYNLFSGFSNWHNKNAADGMHKSSQHALSLYEGNLILSIIDAYTDIWLCQQKLNAYIKKEQNLKDIYDANKSYLDAGATTAAEVSAANANYQYAIYERINAEKDLSVASSKFKQLTGMEAGKDLQLINLSQLSLPSSLDELKSLSLKNNHAILQCRHKEEAAINNVKSARGQLLPQVNVSASRHKTLPPLNPNAPSWNNQLSLSVVVPINSSNNTYSNISIAERESCQAGLEKKDKELEIIKECVDAWNSLLAAKAMILASGFAVQSAKLSSDSNMEEVQHGIKSNTDVWDKENKLLSARISLAESKKARVIQAFKILALTGKLSLKLVEQTQWN